MRKVLTIGVFDLLHYGHTELFKKAKALGDYLIVAVQEDRFVPLFKPEAELKTSLEKRKETIAETGLVDDVISYQCASDIVRRVDFDIFAAGEDQNNASFQEAFVWCHIHKKKIVRIPRTPNISSSDLRDDDAN